VNAESILWQRVATPYWEGVLKSLVERHAAETQSRYAATMLNDWARVSPHFWQVVPKDYVKYLPSPLNEEVAAVSA
jgi:glutamate synthase (NADPH/NADH) large chain